MALELFLVESMPSNYGWNLAPRLQITSLNLLCKEALDLQIVDAWERLMQSVHVHSARDYLHFCMNSAAANTYLDMYWNELFSWCLF